MAHKGHRGQNLSISINPTIAQQAGGQPLFSPALPTALQGQFRPTMPHGLPHPLSLNVNPLQTPLQPVFFPPPSPFVPGHNQRGSTVGLPAGFSVPPPGMIPGVNAPMMPSVQQNNQPTGGHGRSSSVSLPFNRNRRQPSISTGGPPKATLGGPQNKHVAAPLTNPATSAAALEKTLKSKKPVVKPPTEGPNAEGIAKDFTRYPIPFDELPEFVDPAPLDISTGVIYPEEQRKDQLPRTLEVFLPGKDAWDILKRKMIDEKLQKLGVEPSAVPPIFTHGAHGRAASISSPADPNLLLFKLNKLHQHQSQAFSPLSNSGRISVSPGPHASSTSPQPNTTGTIPAGRFNLPGSHRHSMSLANPTQPGYYPNGAFNPFGPNATLGSDQIISPAMSTGSGKGLPSAEDSTLSPNEVSLHAPRGIPGRLGASMTKLDFARGFGLDITEETEEELEEGSQAALSEFGVEEVAAVLQEELDAIPEVDEPHSQAASRRHSRHASRISAALSLRSLGRAGKSDSGILEEEEGKAEDPNATRAWESEGGIRSADDKEIAREWSDDESIGEYSNPSDEERARAAKRAIKAQSKSKDFVRQAQSLVESLAVPVIPRAHEPDSDDIVSNPSEEERMYPRKTTGSRPLPTIPTSASHSRSGSGQPFSHSRNGSGQPLPHNIPLPHSRAQSGQFASNGSGHGTPPTASMGLGAPTINHRDSLNPNAKPFVFGKPWYPSTSGTTPPSTTGLAPATTSANHLNVTAPVFKPNVNAAEFKPSITAKEFVPSATAPEFKPSLLPPIEFNPSGLAGAFKSNPGSGDWRYLVAQSDGENDANPAAALASSEFTFEPPLSAPKLSFPEPAPEEPHQPVNEYGRAIQGREKRLRKDGESDLHTLAPEDPRAEVKVPTPVGADSQTWNNLSSYQFPSEEGGVVEEPEEIPSVTVNKGFIFPPPPKSKETLPVSRTLPQIPSPQITTLQIPAPVAQIDSGVKNRPETTGIIRSPRPLPLTELPRRESAIAEPPTSSGGSSAAGPRALPQPPQRAQTMFTDFKLHPTSTNTVPASLFKKVAANNTPPVESQDDDTPLKDVRTHLRQKLGSIEAFEHNHRPSLDDAHIPMIARKVPRTSDLGPRQPDTEVLVAAEANTAKHQPSSPIPCSAVPSSPDSDVESPVKKQFVVSSQNVDIALDEKFDALRHDLRTLVESHLAKFNATTSNRAEEALMRIAHLMREQAAERRDTAAERIGQSAINSELVRNIVEDSNKEVCASVQRDLVDFARLVQSGVQQSPGGDILRTVEEQTSRIITAVSSATMNLVSRLEAVHNLVEQPSQHQQVASHGRAPSHEDLLRVLRPHLEELRSAPFDVDAVTVRLADAVKPTLANFIDLASDKGETADLIVAKLAPIIASLQASTPDTQELTSQLTASVSRLVPSLDSHVLTEQVADLVIERLDSRLAVRDRQLKPEITAEKVTEAIKPLVASATLNDIINRLAEQEQQFSRQGSLLQALEASVLRSLDDLPEKLQPVLDGVLSSASLASAAPTLDLSEQTPASITKEVLQQLLAAQLQPLLSKVSSENEALSASHANLVETTQQTQNLLDSGLSDLLHGQEASTVQLQELLASNGRLLKQISTIPDHLSSMTSDLHSTQSEFLSKLRSLPDIVDLQNQRIDLQVQLSKARSNYGQVRSEKELLAEKSVAIEADRDRLRNEVQSLKNLVADKEAELATTSSKSAQTDIALQQALARVEASEAVTMTLKEHVLKLEGVQRELQKLGNERQVKVDSLELQLSFANRDKESAQEALKRVEQERDTAVEQQQENWRESRMMSQKIDSLVQMLVSKESEELRELRKYKDRTKGLEAELANAKKRVTELESRVEDLVRSEAKATQSLEDSRRQARDYESKAEKLEREIEPLRRLDDAQRTRDREFEQIRTQLESQEKQEDLLRRTNMELRDELTSLRAELEVAQKVQATAKWQQHQAQEPSAPAYARAAPTLNGRSSALSGGVSSRSNTPPAAHNGVWASMHAPSKNGKVPAGYQSVARPALQATSRQTIHSTSSYRRAASPAQSVASQAPTLREDGWWA